MTEKPTRWVEISVDADRDSVDDIVGFMSRYCSGRAVVEEHPPDISEKPLGVATVKGFLPEWDTETRQKLEIALLLLSRTSPISEPRIVILEPENWAESWKDYFHPQHIGERIVVVPTWREYDAEPDEIIIRLDPGMAFGTGLHATTRLCILALDDLIKPGQRILDVGTGSGILSIAAALQGAGHVDALDTDMVAVEVARENAMLNGVSDVIDVSQGTLGPKAPPAVPLHRGKGYDLLLVNILAEIIIGMAPGIADALRSGGHWVASGIIARKADHVARTLEEHGLVVDRRLLEEDWVALVGHKP
jgi:ribosomal protein L11 methyltransferase